MNSLPDGYTLESVAASARRRDEARQAAAIAEACFQSACDPTQMPSDDATVAGLLDTVPAYWKLIHYRGIVIGSTLILPTSRVLMQGFLRAELTEADLWAALRQTPIRSADCGSLAGAALLAPHRRRGLALASLQTSLDCFLAHGHPRPDVYCWIYSEDGRRFLPALRRRLRHAGIDPAGAAVGGCYRIARVRRIAAPPDRLGTVGRPDGPTAQGVPAIIAAVISGRSSDYLPLRTVEAGRQEVSQFSHTR